MICGYPKRTIGNQGELELKEVSFGFPAPALRDIAKFLLAAADELDKEPDRLYWHCHIDSVISDWRVKCPGVDVVVVDLRTYPKSS